MLGLELNSDRIFKVIKTLNGVPEAGNLWFATCHNSVGSDIDVQLKNYTIKQASPGVQRA